MSDIVQAKKARVVGVEAKAPVLRLPDADSMVENILDRAMTFCAQKLRLSDPETAIQRMKQGDSAACRYCQYSIAKQVAESLGALDENLKAVYVCDYDATPQDICFREETSALLIHLIAWADRKTEALNSLVNALDSALAHKHADLMGQGQVTHTLDVQIVDDDDVEGRRGYGAMLASIHNRPILIWER